MFSEALGVDSWRAGWVTGGTIYTPVAKLVPAHLLELREAVVVLPMGLFFCVSTNWCHSKTVKEIKQLDCGRGGTSKDCGTKGRFVFLPSIVSHI